MDILLFVFPCVYCFFFLSIFKSKISPQPFKIESSNLVYRFKTTSCIVELKMGLHLCVLPCMFFSFFPDFSSKKFPHPFQIETSRGGGEGGSP